MTVRVLEAALGDIDELAQWVEQAHGRSFSVNTRRELFSTFELLARYPRMGRVRSDVTSRPVRFFLVEPYWIVYQPGDPLLIHRVLHGRRDLPRLLRETDLR